MLNRHEILDRIYKLQETGASGLLLLANNGHQITVHFQDGLISAAGSNIPQLKLGRFLTQRGIADGPAVLRLLDESRRRGIPLGKAAAARKLLDGSELEEVVRQQVIQVLTHALNNGFEIRSFEEASGAFFTPARLNAHQMLLELARAHLQPFKLDPGKRIHLTNGRELSGLPWYPQELAVLNELKHQPRTLRELAAAAGLDYDRLGKILNVFYSLQLIAVAEEEPETETTALVRRNGSPGDHLTPEIPSTGLDEKLEAFHNESSFISEQFKTLKVRISEYSAGQPLRVITVSSADSQEGKSLISANLAFCCSRDPGRRVILVDCDLRNPSLHRLVGASLEPGLSGYLQSDYLQPYCYMRRSAKLTVMTAGRLHHQPIELLSLDRMAKLIDTLRKDFDTVILDAPPMAPIADAQILTALSDGLLMVVRSGKTKYRSLERAFTTLDWGKLIGVVLNDVKPMAFNTQYDYKYYHYGYKDHYPYGGRRPSRKLPTYLDE